MPGEVPQVAWAEAPDANAGLFYPLLSPKPGQDVFAIVLSESILGVWTHWYESQTRPCLGSREQCYGCSARLDRRWKGYLCGFQETRGRYAIVEVTRDAYIRCPGFELHKGALRGLVIRLVRHGARPNGKVSASLARYAGDLTQLPPPFNLRSALERLWFGNPMRERDQVKQEEQPPAEQGSRPVDVDDFLYPEGA